MLETCKPDGCWDHSQVSVIFRGNKGRVAIQAGSDPRQHSSQEPFVGADPTVDRNRTLREMGDTFEKGYRTKGGELLKVYGMYWGEDAINITVGGKKAVVAKLGCKL